MSILVWIVDCSLREMSGHSAFWRTTARGCLAAVGIGGYAGRPRLSEGKHLGGVVAAAGGRWKGLTVALIEQDGFVDEGL